MLESVHCYRMPWLLVTERQAGIPRRKASRRLAKFLNEVKAHPSGERWLHQIVCRRLPYSDPTLGPETASMAIAYSTVRERVNSSGGKGQKEAIQDLGISTRKPRLYLQLNIHSLLILIMVWPLGLEYFSIARPTQPQIGPCVATLLLGGSA